MSLGVVLTPYGQIPGGYPPYGITYSFGTNSWKTPFDPQWYTKGEAGMYYDTSLGRPSLGKRIKRRLGLGDFPTDFDIAKRYGFLPVTSGWVTTQQGYQPSGWLPPHGRYPGQPAVVNPGLVPLNGLGQAPGEPPTVMDVMATMQAHNDRIFALTLVSTSAVAISALIGLFRTLKLIGESR